MPIIIYILKRLINTIPILIIVSLMSFAILHNPFIDPLAELRMTPNIPEATIKKEEARLGLNQPLPVQYWLWISNFLQGNMGVSKTSQPVFNRIIERVPNTILLIFISILISWTIALPLGIYSALHWRSAIDRILTVFSSVGMALPSFFFAILMMFFAVTTGLFPAGNLTSVGFEKMSFFAKLWDIVHHLVLPVLVISTISVAGIQRQVRGNLLDVLEADYVKMARAKGLSENKVTYKHALRNAINPLITLLGFEFAALLSGSALVEMVFQYPGMGSLTLQSALEQDINLIMATMMIGTIMLIVGNLLADILLKIVDPRITLD